MSKISFIGISFVATSLVLVAGPTARIVSAQESLPLAAPGPVMGAPLRRIAPALGAVPQQGGITEQGRGVVSLPADRLRVTIHAFPNGGAQPLGAADATGTSEIAKSVLDVMRANGLPDARLETPLLGNLNGGVTYVGSVEKPTHDKVADIEQRIVSKMPPAVLPSLRNVNVNGMLEVDDCSAAVDRARIAAYADARTRAEALARAAGSHLGGLVAASESDQTAGCASLGAATQFYGNGPADALEKTTVDVVVAVSATFSLAP